MAKFMVLVEGISLLIRSFFYKGIFIQKLYKNTKSSCYHCHQMIYKL